MADTTLVDVNGQPLRRSELTKEIAQPTLTGVRNVWQPGVAGDLTPDRLAAILRNAADGDGHEYLTLAEEMEEREPHYGSVLGTRKRAVSGLETQVEAASDDAFDVRLADEIRDIVADPDFADTAEDLLDALGKGYSNVEMMWDRSERQWAIDQFIWRDPRFFKFDHVSGREMRLIDMEDSLYGKPLPAFKFISHVPKLKSGIPLRGGLARLVAVSYMAKSYTVTDWLSFAEIFGMPLRIGRYDDRALEEDVAILRQAVANLGTDAAAVLPKGMEIDFEEVATGQGAAEMFKNLAEWIDKQTSKAVLGQTMTTDDGSSQAQATVHNDVRGDIKYADARQLAATLNRDLVRPYIDLNYGRQKRYPRIKLFIPEPEDLDLMSRVLKNLVPLGLQVEESQVRDKLGFSDPEPGARVLTAPPRQAPAPVALNRATNRQDLTEAYVEDEPDLEDAEDEGLDDWEAQLAPIVDPIEKLAQEVADAGGDENEFLARLPELLKVMDETELVRGLATATLKSRGIGNREGDDA